MTLNMSIIRQKNRMKDTGNSPEIDGTWKQYSERKLSRYFPVDSCTFRQEPARNHPTKFLPEYCFPQNQRNYLELAVYRLDCSTWTESFSYESRLIITCNFYQNKLKFCLKTSDTFMSWTNRKSEKPLDCLVVQVQDRISEGQDRQSYHKKLNNLKV